MSLAVFANFRIDSHERLKRMKDSYYSFHKTKINQWIINIRGEYKNSAAKFLNQKFQVKNFIYQHLKLEMGGFLIVKL